MKAYVHARLNSGDRQVVSELSRATGEKLSELVRRGLRALRDQLRMGPSALSAAGKHVGRFTSITPDISDNPRHMEGYGR